MSNKTLATTPPSPLALADMSVPQLRDAFGTLEDARQRYENLSGVCATLQGLILLEAKRKLGHGKFMPWVEKTFPKSTRTAQRFTRIAEDFIEALSDKRKLKCDTRVAFDAQQLLLSDLAANLSAIEQVKLDMENPLVKAAATYVNGRSFRQLYFDLGDAPKGGDVAARDENGRKIQKKRSTKEETEEEAMRAWAKLALPALVNDYQSGIWRTLPDVGLANYADILKRLAKEAEEVCRSRGISPAKLATWDRNVMEEEADE